MRFLSGSVTEGGQEHGREGGDALWASESESESESEPCGLVKVKVKVSPAGQ